MSCVLEDKESLYHPLLTWCLNKAWSMILQPKSCKHLLRKPVRTDLLPVIDDKLQLKQAPAAKKKQHKHDYKM